MSDQIEKLKETAVGVKVLKEGGRFVNQRIDGTANLCIAMQKRLWENNQLRSLRSSFRNRVKAVGRK